MDLKRVIEEKCNIVINSIKLMGEGYDSKAYIVNDEYVFKIKFSANKKKGYEKEKAIYDFLNEKLITNIKIPNIEYSYISDELSILGYKKVKGEFLTPEIYFTLSKEMLDKVEELKGSQNPQVVINNTNSNVNSNVKLYDYIEKSTILGML